MIGLDRAVAYVVSLDFFGGVNDDIGHDANFSIASRKYRPDDEVDVDDDEGDGQTADDGQTDGVTIGSPRRGNRKADSRRIVASYTRAFLRASGIRLPKKKGTGDDKVESRGPEAFLEWAYGPVYGTDGFWFKVSNPRMFFEKLLLEDAAMRPHSLRPLSPTLASVEDVFRKPSSERHARWVVREDVEERFGFGAEDLARVAAAMRGRAFTREVSE